LGLAFYRGFKSNWEKLRMAKFYFPAYIFYIVGALLVSTVYSGGIENNFLTINVWKIGISLEAVLISLGLADIINALRISDRKKAKELASLNLNLEEKVKLRTKELSESLRNTETLLHNMKQGVFIISTRDNIENDSYDLIVEDKVVSRYSKEIFQQDIKGQNLYDLLYSEIELDSEFGSGIKFALECSFHMDELQWHQGLEFLPQRITKNINNDNKVMRIAYNPLRDDCGDMVKLMIVVEDVTELELLESQMKKQKEKEDSYQRTLQELAPPEGQDVSFHMKQVKKFFNSCNNLIDETFSLFKDSRKESFQDEKNEGVKIILRNLHTLKGNSRTIGFFSLSGLVHNFENDVDDLKNEKGGFDDEAQEKVLTFFTDFKENGLKNYMEIAKNIFSLTFDENGEKEQEHFEISKKKLDKLKETIHHYAPQFPKEVKNIFLDLVLKLTQTPLIDLLKPLKKTIDETSKSLSKNVLFEFNDTDLGLDKKDAQILSDCFVHIVRNSLDHGLETIDERAELGKKDKGKILIHAETVEGEHIISIKDNGRGINHNALADKALQKGLISREDLTGMNKQEKVHLIFTPGFSTKEDVTDLSGRGIGMDVVKSNVHKIGGEIEVKTEVGHGTEFLIKLFKKSA
jgi:two-component sensor histidine kinase/HPt (histidine-containing phosphotransfer) domain-containing protein